MIFSVLLEKSLSGAASVVEQERLTKPKLRPAHIERENIILKLICPNHNILFRFLSAIDESQTYHLLVDIHQRISPVECPPHLPHIPR